MFIYGGGLHNKYCVTDPLVGCPCYHHLQTCTQEAAYLKAHVYLLIHIATKQSNRAMTVTFRVLVFQLVLFWFKAKMSEISSDTHQLQLIKLHHFKLERFKSI